VTSGQTCDTSVLVPALVSWHPHHDSARRAVREGLERVPAHVLLECHSVLTRLPAPHRISPDRAAEVLTHLDVKAVSLPASRHRDLIADLGLARIKGGAVYDALVAATARHHDLRLLTRDRRARATYDAIGVGYTLL
jgi:predicted nucleic acid-binding protein